MLRFEKVIDGTGHVLDAREIVVHEGKIAAIGNDLALAYPQATQIILQNLTAVPGLIDVHVHLTYGLSGPSQGNAWGELLATSAADRLVEASRNARRTLEVGVTTVRDLFAFDGVDFQLKALIDNNVIPGPRMFITGEAIHPMTMKAPANGPAQDLTTEFSAKVRHSIAVGADWVKIFATSGSADDLTGEQIYFYPEIKAATELAHAAGLRVAVHSYSKQAVADALQAGVDSIEHPVGMDDQLLKTWAQTNTVYVPTIDHNRYYAEHRSEYGYDDEVETNLRKFIDRNLNELKRAHKAQVPIAMGSDAVMTMFGQNTRELEWFVEAGLTTQEALQTATMNGAALLGQQDTLGRLKVGFTADIVAVEGDPLKNIQVLTRNVQWVMKEGKVVVERTTRLGD